MVFSLKVGVIIFREFFFLKATEVEIISYVQNVLTVFRS